MARKRKRGFAQEVADLENLVLFAAVGGRGLTEELWGGRAPYADNCDTHVLPCRRCGYVNLLTEEHEPLINDPWTAMVTCKCGYQIGSIRLQNNTGWASPGTQVETVGD
jgi:hypothetical protein